MWRRWPNFGVGLVRLPENREIARLLRWRGERARGRYWPEGLRECRFGEIGYPWIPIEEAQMEEIDKRIAQGKRR